MVKGSAAMGYVNTRLGRILVLKHEDSVYGLVVISPWDMYSAIIDAHILNRFSGSEELKVLSKESTEWIWDNTPFQKLFGFIPDTRQSVVGFFQKGGFKREGVLRDSYYDGDTLHNQTIIGINRNGDS